jgi:hypothetical protein
MRMRVRRTSDYGSIADPPLPGAVRVDTTWNLGTVGGEPDTVPRTVWVMDVEFSDIERLVTQYGVKFRGSTSMVVDYAPEQYPEYPWELEVYDDWRE